MIEYCKEITDKITNGYKLSPKAFRIGEAAITGMLYEASSSPTPGLVSPISNGVHSDMNFFTFLRSTSAISYAMYLCAQIGIDYEEDILKKIRSVGIYAEAEMLRATGGVNTQRGLLFVAGVVCAAAGACVRKNKVTNRTNIAMECKQICQGIVNRELKTLENKGKLSNGEKIYLNYGISGIRGEIEEGLPSVINTGLPAYTEALNSDLGINKALVQALVSIMTVVNDTVVINKAGLEGLTYMQVHAKKAIELGGMYTTIGADYIKEMEQRFEQENISPGGAADLLAITVMLHELEK